MLRRRRGKGRADVCRAGDVTGVAAGVKAKVARGFGNLGDAITLEIEQRQIGPGPRQPQRTGATDAGPGAGHENGLPGKPAIVRSLRRGHRVSPIPKPEA